MSVLFFDGEADPPDPTWQGESSLGFLLTGDVPLWFLATFIPLSFRSTLSPLASPLLLFLSHFAGFPAPSTGPRSTHYAVPRFAQIHFEWR